MQNREVPVGNLPIFFSSRQRAEAGRSRPEVWGGETGRGTRATVCGTQKTGARARGAGRGCGTRKTRAWAWGAGRKTRNTWTWTRTRARGHGHGHGGTGCRTQDAEHGLLAAGSRTRETGARSAEDGRRGHGVQDAEHGLLAAGSRTRETRARGAGDGA